MGLLDQLWDDVVAGPQPERGLEQLKKSFNQKPLNLKDDGSSSGENYESMSMPTTPRTPGASSAVFSPTAARRDNVWRSVFNPGSPDQSMKDIGTDYFDKPRAPNSPTVYDWLYSEGTRTEHR